MTDEEMRQIIERAREIQGSGLLLHDGGGLEGQLAEAAQEIGISKDAIVAAIQERTGVVQKIDKDQFALLKLPKQQPRLVRIVSSEGDEAEVLISAGKTLRVYRRALAPVTIMPGMKLRVRKGLGWRVGEFMEYNPESNWFYVKYSFDTEYENLGEVELANGNESILSRLSPAVLAALFTIIGLLVGLAVGARFF